MGFFSSSESSFGTSIKSLAGPSPVKPNIGDPIRVTLFIRRFCEWAINPERKPPKENAIRSKGASWPKTSSKEQLTMSAKLFAVYGFGGSDESPHPGRSTAKTLKSFSNTGIFLIQ